RAFMARKRTAKAGREIASPPTLGPRAPAGRQRCFQTRLVVLSTWPRSFALERSRIVRVTTLPRWTRTCFTVRQRFPCARWILSRPDAGTLLQTRTLFLDWRSPTNGNRKLL